MIFFLNTNFSLSFYKRTRSSSFIRTRISWISRIFVRGGARTELAVRRGVLLPRIFNQDATLTKENYYILPNGSLIPEDVTVTVEAGTQIQFWTDDPNDVYAQEGVSYFRVNGSLICQGSEEERIRLLNSKIKEKGQIIMKKPVLVIILPSRFCGRFSISESFASWMESCLFMNSICATIFAMFSFCGSIITAIITALCGALIGGAVAAVLNII